MKLYARINVMVIIIQELQHILGLFISATRLWVEPPFMNARWQTIKHNIEYRTIWNTRVIDEWAKKTYLYVL